MVDINRLVAEFSSKETDRIWIVSQLEESVDARVVHAFVSALLDKTDDPSVRVEILKSLVMRRNSVEGRELFRCAVVDVLLDRDDDVVVRQYAASAMRYYVGEMDVLSKLEFTVADETDETDVRFNALSAIEHNARRSDCREALGRLVRVPNLGESARHTLGQTQLDS